MAQRRRQMHLGLFVFGAGQHIAAWRHPRTASDKLLDVELYRRIARKAEEGKLDMLLILEQLAVSEDNGAVDHERVFPTPDTATLATILASATGRIGIGATMTTSYNEPYQLAHKFRTLHEITKGRIGWNMVTTQDHKVAYNFGLDQHYDHTERYLKAAEFVDIVDRLWRQDEAEPLRYEGRWFRVEGNLPAPPLKDGRPARIQAGSSESGMAFGARFADAVFTAQTNLEDARDFYRKLKTLAKERHGREPDEIKIMPGLSPYIADTEEEAKALENELYELTSIRHGLQALSNLLDVDLSRYDPDGPVPIHAINPEGTNNRKARIQIIRKKAEREKLTIRQLVRWSALGSGHYPFVGTPEQLADFMEQWFASEACDGFVIMPPIYPDSVDRFVDRVVPILQERGLFRKEYEGSTILEHLA